MSNMDVFTCLDEWCEISVRFLRFLRLQVNHKLIQTNLKNMEGVDLMLFRQFSSQNIQDFSF